MILQVAATHPRWFEVATASLPALLSDHLHCERKAAENALSLVRRYPSDGEAALALGRLAHEETSHVIQVGELIADRGLVPARRRPQPLRPGAAGRGAPARAGPPPGRPAGGLPDRGPLARTAAVLERGFAARGEAAWPASTGRWPAPRIATPRSSWSWPPAPCSEPEARERLDELSLREAEILAELPFQSRVH